MTKGFYTLLTITTILLPAILFAQSEEDYKVCDDKVFNKVEILPGLKNGKAAFEDSLAGYLRKKNALPDKGKVTFTFIVTKQSKLFDIIKVEGDVKYEDAVKEALISFAALWKPAIQNSHTVCAYVGLNIDFSESKLVAKVIEPVIE